jgi:uncharacterized membrane protein
MRFWMAPRLFGLLFASLLFACSGGAAGPSSSGPADSAEADADDAGDPWEAGREAGLDFLAVGDGWRLEVRGVRLAMVTGGDRATFSEPVRRLEKGRRVYRGSEDGHDLEAVLAKTSCTRDENERSPFTVTVTFDGQSYQGCGRKLR